MTGQSDRVALVTGGLGGLGSAVARHLAEAGGRVVVADVADPEEVDPSGSCGPDVRDYVRLDVTDPTSWDVAVGHVEAAFGRLDVLVNNAGITWPHGVRRTELPDWDRVLRVNLTGPFLGIRAVAELMRKSGGGAIVNVASIAGLIGYPAAAYSASKWGLRGLTRSAALELADWDIRVNAVNPGIVDTPMLGDDEHFVDAFVAMTPAGRLATAHEVAAVVGFLASSQAAYVTGSEIAVDGGLTAAGIMRRILDDAGRARPGDHPGLRY